MGIAINLLGGLGLFLYGMNLMGEGLQKSAGEKLKKIIELLTKNIFIGVLLGTFVTAIIQSSSATTVMVVGFVNAGIMSLNQAIGVIMGANIGTTVTAQLVSFNLEGLAPITLGLGIILYLFSFKPKIRNIAEILLGFGILFTGMEFMKDSVKPLAEFKGFTDALVSFGQRPFLGLLLGFGITAIVQSSSASMGMLIALAGQGLIPLNAALPILYGQNIGTCVTSLISSIGANKNAKRAAIMHLLFNIIGTALFLLLLNRFVISIVTKINPDDVARQIANTHTIFNIVSVLLLLPFTKFIVKIAMKIIPQNKDEENNKSYLDEKMLEEPDIAIVNVIKETIKMSEIVKECLENCMKGFEKKSEKEVKLIFEKEKQVSEIKKSLIVYTLKLSKKTISSEMSQDIYNIFNIINNIEIIGNHSTKILKVSQLGNIKKLEKYTYILADINNMHKKVIDNFENSIKIINNKDTNTARKILQTKDEVNKIEKYIYKDNISKLNNNQDEIDIAMLYIDIIINLQRISDYCEKMAITIIK
ncbi:MAG: Na/Pi cotransporter family protein [Romboutsia sp.]